MPLLGGFFSRVWPRQRRYKPMPWLPATLLVLFAIIGGGWLALQLLSDWADRAAIPLSPKDAATLRLDAIRTALTVAAGLGAGITLLLALRRQSTGERAQHFIEQDAQEQRITELYVAAAEQLGNDKPAVRLAGLYALERLGQNNLHLRQTVMEVICAYLRMPFTPPIHILKSNAQHSPFYLAEDAEVSDDEIKQQPERLQELEVRLTAQQIITNHTRLSQESSRPGNEPNTYWRTTDSQRMNLNLSNAALIELDLEDCHTGELILSRAQIHSGPMMMDAQFHGDVSFDEAQFHGRVTLLSRAEFHDYTSMLDAEFHGIVHLDRAQFHDHTDLSRARFHDVLHISKAKFHDTVELQDTEFSKGVDLTDTQFKSDPGSLPAGWRLGPLQPDGHYNAEIRSRQNGNRQSPP
jgi:hypothetical protein